MISPPKYFFNAIAVGLCVVATGCSSSLESSLDEQKEPHYIAGKSRVASRDFKGAAEEFEKAVEINPRSSSAHLELGLLYEKNDGAEADYAAAIYHLNRYQQLRPGSDYGDIVKQHIIACKQELAKGVSLAPVTQSMQHDLEKLTAENRELRQKLEAWQTYYAGHPQPQLTNRLQQPVIPQPQQIQPQPLVQQQPQTAPRAAKPAQKTYTIKQGDMPSTIAKRNGVSVNALMAANPGLDAKRLKPGQTINLP